MFVENNIYKKPSMKVGGMSSRQQILFIMQKTQKEANWDMENDSDFHDDYSQEGSRDYGTSSGSRYLQNLASKNGGPDFNSIGGAIMGNGNSFNGSDNFSMPFNEEFEFKREKMRQSELQFHPERFRLLAHSLTQFVPIKKNKYLERKRHLLLEKEANSMICTCQRANFKRNTKTMQHQSFNCGDRCINRCVSTECCSQTCPSGSFCSNRKFQLHQNSYVYPAKTEKKGWGLFAGEFIPKGSFIMQYVGEVFSVDSDLGQQRVQKYKNSTCTYLMSTTNNEVIDPTYVGNIARFINHSCDPNCETQKWNVLGEVCVGIFSLKEIKENEELSFDYQFDFFKTPFTKCYCGAGKCKGYLGIATNIDETQSGLMGSAALTRPVCAYCHRQMNERDVPIMCHGQCKETFHMVCVIQREGKQRAQQYAQQLDKRTFQCKQCIAKQKKRRTANQDNDEYGNQENPQEDQPIQPVEILPWESQDPNIRKYFEDSTDNRLLDRIISREIEQIEKDFEIKNAKKKRKSTLSNGQFSEYYNFMCELTKRLKQRIKAGKKSYKFRRQKDLDSLGNVRNLPPQQQIQLEQSKQILPITAPVQTIIKGRRGRPPSSQNLIKKQSETLILQENTSKPINRAPIKDSIEHKKSLNKKILSQSDIPEESEQEDPLEYDDIEDEKEELSKDQQCVDSEMVIDEDKINDPSESLMLDEDQSIAMYEEDGQENTPPRHLGQNDEDDDESDESDDQDDNQYDITGELNLEELQGQVEEQEEEQKMKIDDEQNLRSSIGDKSLSNQNLQIEEFQLRSQLMELSADDSGLVSEIVKRTPIKHISPRKNSLMYVQTQLFHQDQSKEKTTIQSLVRSKIEAFVNEQIYLAEANLEDVTQVRETKINLYESVFNMSIPDQIDDLQCLPNFQLFWDQTWGGMVTLRLISTYKQFNFITNMLQEVTDLMFRSHLLNSNSNKFDSAKHPLDYPFEILVMKVPKNFIRKLVGYQEKTLAQYRKLYQVDFDFNRDLLIDEVFQMNETTQLRIFGKSSDVRVVNELIQKDLSQIQLKTIFLQMSDCKVLMDNVKEVKVHVDPCEIRVKRMTREWRDIRHPFYYIPNYFREMVLIGTGTEIEYAEKQLDKFFQVRREIPSIATGNQQQISFLLPLQLKSLCADMKLQIQNKYPQNSIQVFFYEPTFPRKHITALLIGPWSILMQAKLTLMDEANKHMIRQGATHSFQNFQQFTYHQQIRFSFKSLKRFVLEKDIKYLNHWDLVSVFVENDGNNLPPIQNALPLSTSAIEGANPVVLARTQSILELLYKDKKIPEDPRKQLLGQTQSAPTMQVTTAKDLLAMQEQEEDLQALIHYLKHVDAETCINSLFVLTNSQEDSLESLMSRLTLSKAEIIGMQAEVLKKNINEQQEAVRGGFYMHQVAKPFHHQESQYQRPMEHQSSRFGRNIGVQNSSRRQENSSSSRSPSSSHLHSHQRREVHEQRHHHGQKDLPKPDDGINHLSEEIQRKQVYSSSRSKSRGAHAKIRSVSSSISAKRSSRGRSSYQQYLLKRGRNTQMTNIDQGRDQELITTILEETLLITADHPTRMNLTKDSAELLGIKVDITIIITGTLEVEAGNIEDIFIADDDLRAVKNDMLEVARKVAQAELRLPDVPEAIIDSEIV